MKPFFNLTSLAAGRIGLRTFRRRGAAPEVGLLGGIKAHLGLRVNPSLGGLACLPMKRLGVTMLFCLAPPLVTSGAEFAPPIAFESPNAMDRGWFGAGSISAVPDVNGDGKADIVVCAVNEFRNTQVSPPQTAGRAYLFDGATRELLRELRSPNENSDSRFGDRFGSYAAGIEDVNGDGRGDIIVAPGGENRVYVLDGTTGEPIHTFPLRGDSSSSVPDVNGDGRPDIVIGNYSQGIASIYDGASGALLRSLFGGGFFGWSVSGIPDVNGDGAGDVIVGAWMANQAFIHDGATGERLHTLTGSGDFGRSVAGLGDVNGDGRGDVVVGAQQSNLAYIYDGATGTLVHTLSAPGDPFRSGWVVNRLPDVDGDARDDVVVAGFQDYDQSRIPADAYVFSGASGELLATLPGHSDYGGGRSIAGMPDINGDGLGEVLVANQLGNSSTGVFQAGQVSLYLSRGSLQPPALTVLGWTDEGFMLGLMGAGDAGYELQASEDLVNWTTIANSTQPDAATEFLDEEAKHKDKSRRFYRTRSAP